MGLKILFFTMLVLLAAPASAQQDPAFRDWDQCVGANVADYAEMFGAVSIDAEDVSKALDDCYDAEAKYVAAHPGIKSATVVEKRGQLAAKWLGRYKKSS